MYNENMFSLQLKSTVHNRNHQMMICDCNTHTGYNIHDGRLMISIFWPNKFHTARLQIFCDRESGWNLTLYKTYQIPNTYELPLWAWILFCSASFKVWSQKCKRKGAQIIFQDRKQGFLPQEVNTVSE